jgi:hypothetical protein
MSTSEVTPVDPPVADPSEVVEPPDPIVPRPEKKKEREYKYQGFHGLKYGVTVHERDPVTGQVLKVICRFCLKNNVDHPQIFEVPLRPDKYLNHNKAMHEEWYDYQKLDDEDAISNYWKPITTAEEAEPAPIAAEASEVLPAPAVAAVKAPAALTSADPVVAAAIKLQAPSAPAPVLPAPAVAAAKAPAALTSADPVVAAAIKLQGPSAPATAAAHAPVLLAPAVAAVKAPAAARSAPTVSAAIIEKKSPPVPTSVAFKATISPKPVGEAVKLALVPIASTVPASNSTAPAVVVKPPVPLTANAPTAVAAQAAPVPRVGPYTAATMPTPRATKKISPGLKVTFPGGNVTVPGSKISDSGAKATVPRVTVPGVTVTSASGSLVLPKPPPKIELVKQLVLAPRIAPQTPAELTAGAPARPAGPEVSVAESSAKQHGPSSTIPLKKGVEYYMNVMGETNFVDFLLCREGIPFFQDPALVRGFRRKPPSQRKQAPATPDRRKKGQAEAATPITSNKNKKRRRPEDEVDDEDTRPNPCHLTYNWESLGLGRTIGTAAVNKRLRAEGGKDKVPQLSAIECLHAVQQLKLQTVLPPADSELHTVLQKTRLQTKEELRNFDDADEVSTKKGPCWKTIAELYQDMVAQDLDDGGMYRREYQFLKADQVKERMMRMETDASALQTREDRVRRTATTLGLLNSQTSTRVGEMLGDWPEDSKPSAENCSYWDKDFPRVLRKGGEDTGFLTWHDVW